MGALRMLPCLDSAEMAAARQRELDIGREAAVGLGWSAMEAAGKGVYVNATGEAVRWRGAVEATCAAKLSIPPDAVLPSAASSTFPQTEVQVTNETTLGAARRLLDRGLRPLALNFANGVQPGGGFLSGARAQEETLGRSSALYQTLVDDPMYAAHLRRAQPDSTDWTIYSPHVPVFRADDGTALPSPWRLSFITCAAPYAPEVGQLHSGDLLQKRLHRVLAIAAAYRHAALVLGAWGCGAFGNDPHRTARDFRAALENDYNGAFSDVVFAVADWSADRRFLGAFRDAFASAKAL
jgi:uncharacterized protein (TIGR02452 family)